MILRPEDEEPWLDASRTSFAKAKLLLKPYPEELMDAHDVSPIVNSAKFDGPDCIQPVSDDDMPTRWAVVSVVSTIKSLDTLSALANTLGGIVRPICFAVLRLITNSNFIGCSTGSRRAWCL